MVKAGNDVGLGDLLRQRAAESDLSEICFRDIVNKSAEGIVVVDRDGLIRFANPSAASLLGRRLEELAGQPFLFPLVSGEVSETCIARRSGETVVVEVHVTSTVLGSEPAYVASVRSIPGREQAEEALRESERRYKELADSLPQIVFEIDATGRLTFANRSAFDSMGYTREEFQDGLNVVDMLATEDQAPCYQRILQLLKGDKPSNPEYTVVRKDGSTFPAIVYASPILRHDKVVGLRGVLVDITERKRVEEDLKESFSKLQRTLEGTIQAMALIVEMRDPYTAGHQRRVAHLAHAIANEMGLSAEQVGIIRLAGLIHDIGKIGVPAEILSKPGRLSEKEAILINDHPEVGRDILSTIDFPWPIAQIVCQHHERIDGSGYPRGLLGNDILLEARILAVADVVEAMASHRPYRPALGVDKALEEILLGKGLRYDARAVDACVKLLSTEGFVLDLDERQNRKESAP